MRGQLATIWRYRYFWMSLVSMDLRTRYRRSVLGIGWSLMNPLLMTVVLCIVFRTWFHNPDWRSFGPYVLAGLTLFEFVRSSCFNGCQTFFRNESYIRQCPLPLAIYTLRTMLGGAVHYLFALAVVVTSILILLPQQWLSVLQVVWVLVPGLLLLLVFCWSCSALAAFLTVYFQDTQQIFEVLFQVFFFLTPIMYPASMIVDHGLGMLLDINPVAAFLDLIREPLLTGAIPSGWAYAKAGIMVTLFGGLAVGAFAKLEKRLIFHL